MRSGLVLALYVVVALGTAALAGRRLLPLFDGFTRPPAYEWVSPPKLFAPGNVVPQPASASAAFASGRSSPVSLATPDAQCSLSLAAGSVLLRPGDDRAAAVITPIDPGRLGPLPSGLHANGNAYRVSLTSQPSAQPIGVLDVPGDVVLTAPEPIRALLYSPDGGAWQPLETHAVGDATVGASLFSRAGLYLAAGDVDPATAGSEAGRGRVAGTIVVTLFVVGLAAAFLIVPSGLRRLRGRLG
jgi:hypothetical protein